MTFFNLELAQRVTETIVYVKVDGEMQKFRVDTGDYFEARMTVIQHLDAGFKRHGAVMALVL